LLHCPYWRYLNIHRRRNWINVVQKLCTTDQYILPFNMYRCETKRAYECARSMQTDCIASWHTQPHIHTHALTHTHRAHQGIAFWFHDSLESDKIQLISFYYPTICLLTHTPFFLAAYSERIMSREIMQEWIKFYQMRIFIYTGCSF